MKHYLLTLITLGTSLLLSERLQAQNDSNEKNQQHVVTKMIIHTTDGKNDSVVTHTFVSNQPGEIDSILKVLMPHAVIEHSVSDSVFNQFLNHQQCITSSIEFDSLLQQFHEEFQSNMSHMQLNMEQMQINDSLIETFDLHFDPLNFDQFTFEPCLPEGFEHELDSIIEKQMIRHDGDSCRKLITIKDDGSHLTLEHNGEIVFIDKMSDISDIDSQIEYETDDEGKKVIVVKTRIVLQDVSTEEAEQLGKNGIKTSAREPEFAYLRFYPNPAENMINIEFKSDKPADTKVLITDMLGKTLYEEKLNDFQGNYAKQVDLGQFGKGTYILQILQGRKSVTRKIIID